MTDSFLNVLATHTVLPPLRHSADTVEAAFDSWLAGQSRELRTKAKRILRNAGVQHRHSFLTAEEIFSPCDLTESSARYREAAIRFGTDALRHGLRKAMISPEQVDILITTSCTGYMIPSVDAYMADELRMRADLIRLPVTEMGCAAGASALIYACEMLRARPGSVAAIVNVELPTNTMQHADYSMDNIVGTALFSDGVACTVIQNQPHPGVARVRDWRMHQVDRTTGILGYQLTESGFRMNLDPSLPEIISDNLVSAIRPMLARNGLALHDIKHFAIHPGGVKIIDRVEAVLAEFGGSASHSRAVMSTLGNMSSSTVIFILEQILASEPAAGPMLLLSFGPGFGAHQLLIDVGNENC